MLKISRFRVHSLLLTGVVFFFSLSITPIRSQESEPTSAEETSTVVEESTSAEETSTVEEEPVTTGDINIPVEDLRLLVKPLTVDQLKIESDAWLLILQNKVKEISFAEVAINKKNRLIDAGEEATEKMQEEAAKIPESKEELIIKVTELQEERTAIVDRFKVVVDEFERKGGDPESYQNFLEAATAITFDVQDTQGLGIRVIGWLKSEEGGIRLLFKILTFVVVVVAVEIVARILSNIAGRALGRISGVSNLFTEFTVIVIRRSGLALGVIFGLAIVGLNLGPVLALIGGASFILAFALQSNLGNFASGLMLLVNKPFDVGDEVKVAGYWAFVDSITLASTKLKAFNGSIVTLPNNTVWGGDIINYTHADIRKHLIPIYIKFEQDMNQVYQMWMDITSSHPKILKDPAPGWFPWNSHYEYYISVSLSAWTAKDDYWPVYVDLIKELQKRMGELNIQLAAPQQEIKLAQYLGKTLTQSSVETITPSKNHE